MERVKEFSAAAGIHSCTVRDPQKRRVACQTNVTGRFRGGDKVFCQRVCEVHWIPIVGYLIGIPATCDWISGSPSVSLSVCLDSKTTRTPPARTEAKVRFELRLSHTLREESSSNPRYRRLLTPQLKSSGHALCTTLVGVGATGYFCEYTASLVAEDPDVNDVRMR